MLTTDGRVFSWGTNSACLGYDPKLKSKQANHQSDKSSLKDSAQQLMELELVKFYEDQKRDVEICQLATGRDHVLALDTSGAVYAWGSNKYYQLGIRDRSKAGEALNEEKDDD